MRLAAIPKLLFCAFLRGRGGFPRGTRELHVSPAEATLTFLLSELPYVVALIRTRNLPDRAGLALAMAAGFLQILASWFFTDLRYRADLPPPSGWLSGSLGLLIVVLAYLPWRTSPTRKQDVGLLLSVAFGMLACTVFAQIGLRILIYREQLWRQM